MSHNIILSRVSHTTKAVKPLSGFQVVLKNTNSSATKYNLRLDTAVFNAIIVHCTESYQMPPALGKTGFILFNLMPLFLKTTELYNNYY
jgi:hypothetical protein